MCFDTTKSIVVNECYWKIKEHNFFDNCIDELILRNDEEHESSLTDSDGDDDVSNDNHINYVSELEINPSNNPLQNDNFNVSMFNMPSIPLMPSPNSNTNNNELIENPNAALQFLLPN